MNLVQETTHGSQSTDLAADQETVAQRPAKPDLRPQGGEAAALAAAPTETERSLYTDYVKLCDQFKLSGKLELAPWLASYRQQQARLVLVRRDEEEAIPLARRGLVEQFSRQFAAAGWPERYGQFDPQEHPRGQPENAGRFRHKDEGAGAEDGGSGKGDGGREPDEHQHRKEAKEKIGRHLAEASYLTPAQQTLYRAAAHAVIDAMGNEALRRWNANVSRIKFYPSTEGITEFAKRRNLQIGPDEMVRGLCVASLATPGQCELHLNGGLENGQSRDFPTREIHAHEFAHAVDFAAGERRHYSSQTGWVQAWRDEIRLLGLSVNEKAKRDPHEGFAEFGRLAWLHADDARRRCPQCWKFWTQEGLA